MIIGIDGSRAFLSERTGTENYSYHMLRALSEVDHKNQYQIYLHKDQTHLSLRGENYNKSVSIKSERRGNLVGETSFGRDCFARPGRARNDDQTSWPPNFTFIPLCWPRLYTQAGLALRTWADRLDLLWVPAHTLPILSNPGLPLLVTLHGIEFQHLPGAYRFGQNLHLTWSTRWASHRANKIIAVSQKTKQDLINWLHVNPKKVEVIYEGVDLERFKNSSLSLRARPGRAKQSRPKLKTNEIAASRASRNPRNDILDKYNITPPYILFVGTIQPRKNLVRLIEAFSNFVHDSHFDSTKFTLSTIERFRSVNKIQLVLAGKLGWDYQDILEAPQKYGVGDRVKFLGYFPDQDLPALYHSASCYVEPSLQEGFGLPVLEAMASGIPTTVADAGALPEIAGDSAILFDPYSVTAISNAFSLIFTNQHMSTSCLQLPEGSGKLTGQKLANYLIKRGHQQAAKFSWQQAAQQLLKVFQQVSS